VRYAGGAFYSGPLLQRGMTVRGDAAGALPRITFGPTISALPAGERVVLSGCVFSLGGATLSGCQGLVVLEDCVGHFSASASAEVDVVRCAMSRATANQGSLVSFHSSTVSNSLNSAIQISRSAIELVDTAIAGATFAAYPAIAGDGTLRVLGGSRVSAGSSTFAISITGSVVIAANAAIVGSIRGSVSSIGTQPFLRHAALARSGGMFSVSVFGASGATAVPLFNLDSARVPLPGLESPLLVGPGAPLALGAGSIQGSAGAGFAFPVPADPTIHWARAFLQALTIESPTATVALSGRNTFYVAE
jgi:hypothetical protein